ncbi:hypothetical protein OG806_49190 [Streptomyces sp. NBC_00882]|uniref:hypothetical protein n=1 Tax=Streptomyces TaxID=1883 RepID=UPI00386D8163|nr:hypothetical protein OG806_49190 [Streptomyces sp. NBC_00882]WSZ63786.1 hypothetical protein OH824_48465 [Streptomyces canus]
MPDTPEATEVLVISGRIDRAGQFRPGRCRSTRYVRRWPRAAESAYVAELLDRMEEPVQRVPALVVREQACDPTDDERFLVTAYLGLSREAVMVQLRKDDLVLWRRDIPEPPGLGVRLPTGSMSRDRPVRLSLELSRRGEGAYLQVIYQWGERRFQTVDVLAPQSEVNVDLAQLPGGEACRFVVIYSNGLRSAVAASDTFHLEPLGPSVTIVEPSDGAGLVVGQHLVLAGQAVDLERAGGARTADLSWWLDSDRVAVGPIGGVDRLASGEHRVTLRYEGEGRTEEAEVGITVTPAQVPTAEEWEPFDQFSGY